jgi:hypothetical protein
MKDYIDIANVIQRKRKFPFTDNQEDVLEVTKTFIFGFLCFISYDPL